MSLADKAMKVNLSISYWTGKASDERVTDEITRKHKTADDVHDYQKILVHPDAINRVKAARSRARAYHFEKTLPWIDGGTRILPAVFHKEYADKMHEFRGEYEEAVAEFIRQYARLKGEARKRLGDLFRDEDYPGVDKLRRKFGFSILVEGIQEAGDWRVKLGAKEEAAIRKQIEKQLADTAEVLTRDLWQRLYKVVRELAEKLKEKDATFRDSIIGNIKDVVALLPYMNVADDPKLEDMRRKVEADLAKLDVETLKDDPKVRKQARDAADDLLARMSGYTGER